MQARPQWMWGRTSGGRTCDLTGSLRMGLLRSWMARDGWGLGCVITTQRSPSHQRQLAEKKGQRLGDQMDPTLNLDLASHELGDVG